MAKLTCHCCQCTKHILAAIIVAKCYVYRYLLCFSEMSEEGQQDAPQRRAVPRLNERILSSLSRRAVAAHPWHDLEIGTYSLLLLVVNIKFLQNIEN